MNEPGPNSKPSPSHESARSPCIYCALTKRICFWGMLVEYRPWRRGALLALSASLIAFLLFVIGLAVSQDPIRLDVLILTIPLLLLSILPIPVAIHGCNDCVVRLWGNV